MNGHGRTDASNPLAGSAQEFDRLIESLHPAALLLATERRMSSVLRLRVSPEDILQEALLHAWRDRQTHRWEGLRPFRTWLLTIIDHRIADAHDHAVAQKRGGLTPIRSLASGNGSELDLPRSTTPSRVAWHREQAEVIRTALEALPDEVREVVRLRLVEQLPIETIARQLGIGDSAVRHRFRRGAELFRRRVASALGSVDQRRNGDSAESSTLGRAGSSSQAPAPDGPA